MELPGDKPNCTVKKELNQYIRQKKLSKKQYRTARHTDSTVEVQRKGIYENKQEARSFTQIYISSSSRYFKNL